MASPQKFIALWDKLDVRYDGWAATTDPLTRSACRRSCSGSGMTKVPHGASRWIYKESARGFYSVRQEQFLTDKERGDRGRVRTGVGRGRVSRGGELLLPTAPSTRPSSGCSISSTSAAATETVRHSRFPRRPNCAMPSRKSKATSASPVPKSRLSWGIAFPFDPDFVTYVWFDALVNYISFAPATIPRPKSATTISPEFHRAGGRPLHVIGKDILIPAHGVYWPIMLQALGFADDECPTLLVHGWWNIAGAKMSKSLSFMSFSVIGQIVARIKRRLSRKMFQTSQQRIHRREFT